MGIRVHLLIYVAMVTLQATAVSKWRCQWRGEDMAPEH